jgi:DNA-binding transcriptional LysR family regulator
MNLDYLVTFMEVARTGSFSEVAKMHSISQPAVSFQIRKLEHELGIRLIDRSQKTLMLTEAGKKLLRFAENVGKEQSRLLHELDLLREDISGNLLISASTIPGEFLLPSILGKFRALHPAVTAQVVISDSITVINCVQNGDYDIGFCGITPKSRELDYFKVDEDEIVLIVFPEHPFAQRSEVSLIELEREPLISRESTSGTQQNLEMLLSNAGLDTKKLLPQLILSTTQAVVSAVESRAGIAFVSNLAINKSLSLGLINQVPVSNLKLQRDFYCIFRRERVVSRLLGEFISYVRLKSAGGETP